MAPNEGNVRELESELREREQRERTRSPHEGVAAALVRGAAEDTEEKKEAEKKEGEAPMEEKKDDKKRKVNEELDKPHVQYTDEEWRIWREQQAENYRRMEQRQEEFAASSSRVKEVSENALLDHGSRIMAAERHLKAVDNSVLDLQHSTTLLAQWSKEAQQTEAASQVTLLGWKGEGRSDRKKVVERWLTQAGCWDKYVTTRTLEDRSTRRPLTFSLLLCHTPEDREEVLRSLQRCKMFGMYGEEIWGRKNMPRHQREAGSLLRYLMKAVELCRPGTTFSHKGWGQEALMAEDIWIAAIVKGEGRQRIIMIDTDFIPVEQFEKEARSLWKVWGDWHKRRPTSSTTFSSTFSSTSSTPTVDALMAPQPRVFYVQEFVDLEFLPLTDDQVTLLDGLKEEKDNQREERALAGRTQKPSKQEEEPEEPKPGVPSVFAMDAGDPSTDEDDPMTAKDAWKEAKQRVDEAKQGGAMWVPKKSTPKKGSSADAINTAKYNLEGYEKMESDEDGQGWGKRDSKGNISSYKWVPNNPKLEEGEEEVEEGYYDKKGNFHFFNSGPAAASGSKAGGKGIKKGGNKGNQAKHGKGYNQKMKPQVYYHDPQWQNWEHDSYGDMGNASSWWGGERWW